MKVPSAWGSVDLAVEAMRRAVAISCRSRGKMRIEAIGVPGITSHDLRHTWIELCRAAGGEFAQTTKRYLVTKQDLVHAPNDTIKLTVTL